MFKFYTLMTLILFDLATGVAVAEYGELSVSCHMEALLPMHRVYEEGSVTTEGTVDATALKMDDDTLLMGSEDEHVYLFDFKGNVQNKTSVEGKVSRYAAALDGGSIGAVGTSSGYIHLIDTVGNNIDRVKVSDGEMLITAMPNGRDMVVQSIADGNVYQLIREERNKAQLKHLFTAEEGEYARPLVVDDMIVVGSKSGKIYSYNMKRKKTSILDGVGDRVVVSSPFSDGTFLAGSENGKMYYGSLAENKPLTVLYDAGSKRIDTPPAVTKNSEADQVVAFGTSDGRARFIDLAKKRTGVSFLTKGIIYVSPTIMDDGTVIMISLVSNDESHLHFFNPNGTPKAMLRISGAIYSPATVVKDSSGKETIIVGSTSNKIHLLQLSDESTYNFRKVISVSCPPNSLASDIIDSSSLQVKDPEVAD